MEAQALSGLDDVLGDFEPPPVVPAHVSTARPSLTPQPAGTPQRPAIPFEWAREFADAGDDLQEIVEGVFTRRGISCIFGPSNSGKTYMAAHLAICISRGTPWLGRRVAKGAVIYIAGEGAMSFRRRIKAFSVHTGSEVGAIGLIPTALNLMDPSADVDRLIDLVAEKASEIGEEILLVIVDTVARAMMGGNENASEDMARLISAGDRIREETGAHVAFIHHSGKDADRGARGHSSLRAALDTEIEVTADESQALHFATITKQRDLATKGLKLAGRFVPVVLGTDQWGNAVTACAVETAEVPAGQDKARKGLSGPQQAILGFLKGSGTAVLRTELVAGLGTANEVKRTTAYRALKELAEAGVIREVGGFIHLINP
jgi:hypothetical protein